MPGVRPPPSRQTMFASSASGCAQRIGPIVPNALHPSLVAPIAGATRGEGGGVAGLGAGSSRSPKAGATGLRLNRAGSSFPAAPDCPSADIGSDNNTGRNTRRLMIPLRRILLLVHTAKQRIHRRLPKMCIVIVDQHHHDVAAAATIEHIAGHRTRIRQQPGLDMRLARDVGARETFFHRAIDGDQR